MGIIQKLLQKQFYKEHSRIITHESINLFAECYTPLQKVRPLLQNLASEECSRNKNKFQQQHFTSKLISVLDDLETESKKLFANMHAIEKMKEDIDCKKINKNLSKMQEYYKFLSDTLVEDYSYFLVKVQIDTNLKNDIKNKFIELIKTLHIPLHTDEILEVNQK